MLSPSSHAAAAPGERVGLESIGPGVLQLRNRCGPAQWQRVNGAALKNCPCGVGLDVLFRFEGRTTDRCPAATKAQHVSIGRPQYRPETIRPQRSGGLAKTRCPAEIRDSRTSGERPRDFYHDWGQCPASKTRRKRVRRARFPWRNWRAPSKSRKDCTKCRACALPRCSTCGRGFPTPASLRG